MLTTIALTAAIAVGDTTRPAAAAAPATWVIDQTHSELTFKVRHLTGRVRGSFKEWSGAVTTDPAQLGAGATTVEVKTGSINTENADRDAHLRSPDFFDSEKYPTMTFKSTKVEVKGSDIALHGDLTIKGVTKPVVLKGAYTGRITDPWGKERIAFEASTLINRKDFGLTWGKMVEGVALVGDEVTIELAIEAVKS
jgi:polyisoprenoid-binding protein YceI